MKAFPAVVAILISTSIAVSPLQGRSTSAVTASGAASAGFAPGATLDGVSVSALRTGFGVEIAGDGTAAGQFETTLTGTSTTGEPRTISITGKVTGGSSGTSSTATFSGTCTIDRGDGSTPAANVPFTVSIAIDESAKGTISLTFGASKLPAATVTDGTLSIR